MMAFSTFLAGYGVGKKGPFYIIQKDLFIIRELYLEAKIRFITGRPRKAEKRLQMKKSTTKKKGCENKSS